MHSSRILLRSMLFVLLVPTLGIRGAAQADPYVNGSVNWYYWDGNGKTWLLLGKESRRTGEYWYSFGGKKDKTDSIEAQKKNMEPSLYTAIREGEEETADMVHPLKDGPKPVPFYAPIKIFSLQMNKPKEPYTAIYFVRAAEQVDPAQIAQAAKKLGARAHTEKIEWAWVDAQDLLTWAQDAKQNNLYDGLDKPLYPVYLATLQDPKVIQYLFQIIADGAAHAKQKAAVKPVMVTGKPAKPANPAQPLAKKTVIVAKPCACILPYSWTPKGETWILLGLEEDEAVPGGYAWSDFCIEGTQDMQSAEVVLAEQTGNGVALMNLGKHPKSFKQGARISYVLPVTYKDSAAIEKAARGNAGVKKIDWKWVPAANLVAGEASFKSHAAGNPSYKLSPALKAVIDSKEMQALLNEKMQEGKRWAQKKK